MYCLSIKLTFFSEITHKLENIVQKKTELITRKKMALNFISNTI